MNNLLEEFYDAYKSRKHYNLNKAKDFEKLTNAKVELDEPPTGLVITSPDGKSKVYVGNDSSYLLYEGDPIWACKVHFALVEDKNDK